MTVEKVVLNKYKLTDAQLLKAVNVRILLVD